VRGGEARSYYLDARNFESTPESFSAALRTALNLTEDKSVLHALSEQPHVHAFLIDTTEILLPIDNWLRDVCLPQLPENTLVIMAGREPPSAAWQSDAGWQTLIRVLPLRNLSPDESRAYLNQRDIPEDQQQPILNFTHGFPLALSLVADVFAQRQDLHTFEPEARPDLVGCCWNALCKSARPGASRRIGSVRAGARDHRIVVERDAGQHFEHA
jgi:hypothetical protein